MSLTNIFELINCNTSTIFNQPCKIWCMKWMNNAISEQIMILSKNWLETAATLTTSGGKKPMQNQLWIQHWP